MLVPGVLEDHRMIHPWDGGLVEPRITCNGIILWYGFGSPSSVSQEGSGSDNGQGKKNVDKEVELGKSVRKAKNDPNFNYY